MENKYTTRQVQECILSIIKDVDKFCKDNNIQYYLMGGSALGAMRHHGFIPWDDDLDVFMTYDNYQKFLKLFKQECQKGKYFLQEENTNEWPLFLSRVCLNGTTMISNEFKNNLKQHHSVFVDIMCLYSAPDNNFKRLLQYGAAQLLRVNALAKCRFPNKNIIKKIMLVISRIIVNPISRPLLIKYVCKYEKKKTNYMGHYFGRARYKKACFLREYIGEPRYVKFEDTELPVFENVEKYLVNRFGSKWMENPSEEVKNQYPIHGDFVDLKKDYTEYMSKDKKRWIV